jgi:hypothetical protein
MKSIVSVSNPNEITKSEFDELDKIHEFEKHSHGEIISIIANVASLIKKGETNQLTPDELESIKTAKAELNNLTHYTINDIVNKHIVKSEVYVQKPQVRYFDEIQKSETGGEKIEKGIFLDTPLNRELKRVGDIFQKGMPFKKSSEKDEIETSKDEKPVSKKDEKETTKESVNDNKETPKEIPGDTTNTEKSLRKGIAKHAAGLIGKGMTKPAIFKAVSEKYPESEKEVLKSCINKAYEKTAKNFLEKSQDPFEDEMDDKTPKKETTEKSEVHKSLNSVGVDDDTLQKAKFFTKESDKYFYK